MKYSIFHDDTTYSISQLVSMFNDGCYSTQHVALRERKKFFSYAWFLKNGNHHGDTYTGEQLNAVFNAQYNAHTKIVTDISALCFAVMHYRDDLNFCDVINRVLTHQVTHTVDTDLVLALVVSGLDVDLAVNIVSISFGNNDSNARNLAHITAFVRTAVFNNNLIALLRHGMSSLVPIMRKDPRKETFIDCIAQMRYMCNTIDFINRSCYTNDPHDKTRVEAQLKTLNSSRFVQLMSDVFFACFLSYASNNFTLSDQIAFTEKAVTGAFAVNNRFPDLANHVMTAGDTMLTTDTWDRVIIAHCEPDTSTSHNLFSHRSGPARREDFFSGIRFYLDAVTVESIGVTDDGENSPNSAYCLMNTAWENFSHSAPEPQLDAVLKSFCQNVSSHHVGFPEMFMEAVVAHSNGDSKTLAHLVTLLLLCNITSYRDGERLVSILDNYNDFVDLPLTWVADMLNA